MKPVNLKPISLSATFMDLDFTTPDDVTITVDDIILQAKDALSIFEESPKMEELRDDVNDMVVENSNTQLVVNPIVPKSSNSVSLLSPVSLIDENFDDADINDDDESTLMNDHMLNDEEESGENENLADDVRDYAEFLVQSYLPIGLRNVLPRDSELPNKLNLYLTELYVRDIMRLQDQVGLKSALEFPQFSLVDKITNGELPSGFDFDTYRFKLQGVKSSTKIHELEYQLIQSSFKELATVASSTILNKDVKHVICTVVNVNQVLTSDELQCIIYILV
jgi:hypothetical protein